MKKYSVINILAVLILTISFISCSFESGNNPTINPSVPNSPSPPDGATNISNVVSLEWQAENAEKYDVYFDTVNPPVRKEIANQNTNQLTVVASGFSMVYYWKVVAISSDGTRTEGPVWRFTTKPRGTSEDGYVMINYTLDNSGRLQTTLPNFVNVLFQVLDLNGVGVENLTTSDFNLYEDNQPISPSESNMQIRKRDENPYTLRTVLVLDNSTSLEGEIAQIRTAALDFVNNIISQQEVAVYEFSARPVLLQDFTSDKSLLSAAVNSYDLGAPTTNLFGAVVEGASRMEDIISVEEIVQSTMIIFTDGNDTQGSTTFNEALDAINGRRVYTVGLGPEISPDTLEAIGNSGYFQISEAGDLTQIFRDIADEISKYANSFYWLNYSSPKEGNMDHLLKLEIKDNQYDSYLQGVFNSAGFYHPDREGIYINASENNPNGIDEDELSQNGEKVYQAVTYLASVPPVYIWENLTPSIIEVNQFENDDSQARIVATGSPTEVGLVKITDSANSFTKTLQIKIK